MEDGFKPGLGYGPRGRPKEAQNLHHELEVLQTVRASGSSSRRSGSSSPTVAGMLCRGCPGRWERRYLMTPRYSLPGTWCCPRRHWKQLPEARSVRRESSHRSIATRSRQEMPGWKRTPRNIRDRGRVSDIGERASGYSDRTRCHSKEWIQCRQTTRCPNTGWRDAHRKRRRRTAGFAPAG